MHYDYVCVMVNFVSWSTVCLWFAWVCSRIQWCITTMCVSWSTLCHGQPCVMVNLVSWSILCHGQRCVCGLQQEELIQQLQEQHFQHYMQQVYQQQLLHQQQQYQQIQVWNTLPHCTTVVATSAAAVPANTGNWHGRHCQYETLYHTALQ